MSIKPFICTICPKGCSINVYTINGEYTVKGNRCKRGKKYVLDEIICPKRIITTTVQVEGSYQSVTSVKTSAGVAKESIFDIMDIINNIKVKSPCKVGDITEENIGNTGVDLIITRNIN